MNNNNNNEITTNYKQISNLFPGVYAAKSNEKVELYSKKYYGLCSIAGILSCGLTHCLMTPVDLVKCRKQTGAKYKSVFDGFSQIIKNEGALALTTGWLPTLVGYSFQGFFKFGLYEIFKKVYADAVGEENFKKYKDLVYVSGSASAEFFADIALCPWEAVKVKIQTTPGYAKGLLDGMPRFYKEQGFGGFYKGIVPLWGRQIPYTIMKFTAFERIVSLIYNNFLSKPKNEYNKLQQLGVSFMAGYIAGVFCATISHPADVIVSIINKSPGKGFVQIAKEIGFKGCWSGLLPRIFMVGTLTALQWGIYDAFKVYFNLPTTGHVEEKKKV